MLFLENNTIKQINVIMKKIFTIALLAITVCCFLGCSKVPQASFNFYHGYSTWNGYDEVTFQNNSYNDQVEKYLKSYLCSLS